MSVYNDFRNREHKLKSIPLARKIMDIVMGAIYVSFGIIILLFDAYENGFIILKPPFNYFFGSVLLLYGIFRFYRFFSKKK